MEQASFACSLFHVKPLKMLPFFALFSSLLADSIVGPEAKPLLLTSPVADKNFYLLSLIERDAKARQTLSQDTEFRALAETKAKTLKSIFPRIDFGKVKPLEDIKFSEKEIYSVSEELGHLAATHRLDSLILNFRRSGTSQNIANLPDAEFLAKAWTSTAQGLNRVIDVYGLQSMAARTGSIDSPIYNTKNPLYGGMIKTMVGVAAGDVDEKSSFFAPTLNVACRLLEVQLRDEAGRHEPMEKGVNREAYRRAQHTDFSRYPYTAILVPGYGPEESEVRLSPIGRMENELAARCYRQGKAPFIIVSGGYVHPSMTPYSEAIEMKKSLIADFGIPESAILVDPHARHTTTNIRNAVRLMFRYGMPVDKPGLIVTNSYQRADIESKAFFRRCESVFGFQPATNYTKKSEFELSFVPNLVSLTMDPIDPLDP